MATHATVWSGILSQSSGPLSVGYAVVKNGDDFLPATTANRASYGRAVGVAITAADSQVRSFEYQVAGVISTDLSGLGTGTAGDSVIVDANGALTRTASPGGSDDIIGTCPGTSADFVVTPCASDGGGGGSSEGATGVVQTSDGAGGFEAGEYIEFEGADPSGLAQSGLIRVDPYNGRDILVTRLEDGSGDLVLISHWTPAAGKNELAIGNGQAIGTQVSRLVLSGADFVRALAGSYTGWRANAGGVLQLHSDTEDGGGGVKVLGIDNATTNPTTNPTAGIVVYVDAADNTLKYRQADGTIVTLDGSGGSLDTTDGTSPQAAVQVETTDDTPTDIGDPITLATDSVATVDVAVQCIQVGAAKAKVFNVRRSFLNNGGVVTDGTQLDLLTAEELGGALAASVDITRSGTTVQPQVTGVAATDLRWYLISQEMSVTAGASLLPDAPIAVVPDTGDPAGGDAIVIEVTDSTGLTGASLGGVALTGFAIDDATHVSGTTGAHAAGAVDVIVTNASGNSGPLVGGFTYASGFDYAAFNWALDLRGADLTTSSIPGTASAGTSGTLSFDSTAANTIAAGAAMNGVQTYDNDTDNIWSFADGWAVSDLVAAAKNAYTFVLVLRANAISTDGSAYHNRKYLLGTGGGSAMFGIGLYDNAGTGKVCAGHFDGGSFREREVTVVVGTPIIVQVRLSTASSGSLEIRANKGAWSTLTGAGVIDTVTAYLTNQSSNGRADADIARMSMSPTAITDGDLDDICDYLGGLYGITV